MAERAKKKIEGRTSNKFVSTFPAFMWQAEKKGAVSLAGGIAGGGRTNGNTAKRYTQGHTNRKIQRFGATNRG
jgi:hypothetical protein